MPLGRRCDYRIQKDWPACSGIGEAKPSAIRKPKPQEAHDKTCGVESAAACFARILSSRGAVGTVTEPALGLEGICFAHDALRPPNCTDRIVIFPPRVIGFTVLLLQLAACAHRRTFAERIATPELPEFSDRVKNYTALVDGLEKNLAPLPDHATAEQINQHKKALADAVRKARPNARPGNIFTPDSRRFFVKTVRSEVHGSTGHAAKTTLKEDNPTKEGKSRAVPLAVNSVYPDKASLSTVPPTLLLRLPTLPATMEYRFVGRALILRDVRANLIVDYIPGTAL